MTSAYIPIACTSYDIFEIAIMRHERLQTRWIGDDGIAQEALIMPLDLATRDRAEWLIAQDQQGGLLNLRLDRIETAEPEAKHPQESD